MNIKVGDKVRYTGHSECDLTHGKVYPVVYASDGWLDVVDDVGDEYGFSAGDCETVTDTPHATPDYNNGEWYGWNGGECPVHPETRGELLYADGTTYSDALLGNYKFNEPLLFRVTKPYVEPKKPREWLISMTTMHVQSVPSGFKPDGSATSYVHVREVLDD